MSTQAKPAPWSGPAQATTANSPSPPGRRARITVALDLPVSVLSERLVFVLTTAFTDVTSHGFDGLRDLVLPVAAYVLSAVCGHPSRRPTRTAQVMPASSAGLQKAGAPAAVAWSADRDEPAAGGLSNERCNQGGWITGGPLRVGRRR